MKIAILTYHAAYNFGANLQAMATSCYLKNQGHEPRIIDFGRKAGTELYRKVVPKQQWEGHDIFIEKRLPLTKEVGNDEDLIRLLKEEAFDGIIVGADAVWSYPARYNEIPVYFMRWLFDTPDINQIPVATMSVANMSNGFRHLEQNIKNDLKRLISKFSFLSVRDEWTRYAVNNHIFNGEDFIKIINPDPVFILDDFIDDVLNRNGLIGSDQKYIICTFQVNAVRMSEWFSKFKAIANEKGIMIGELPLPEGRSNLKFDFTVPYPIDPVQWYLWLKNAEGFLGLRFHAVVSCITAGVPFYSIDNYGNSSLPIRIANKLGCYRLGRMFDTKSKIFQLLKSTNFRYHRVNCLKGLLGVNPRNVFYKLQRTNRSEILDLKNFLANQYDINMKKILNTFERNNK